MISSSLARRCFGNISSHKIAPALQVHLIEIDIDVDAEVAQAGGVQSTPTVQMFKNKALIQHLPGVKMKREYRKFISEAMTVEQ